ncbi:MAG TPA: hypothetical protein VFA53_02155 [Xanthobacteraceae bacterium]|nr:hypothetical protein [Xanthobacteraceae bacterium]
MAEFAMVTEDELERARREPEFRRKLLADSLDVLLATLNRMRNSKRAADPVCAGQIREGVELAIKLAEMLQATADAAAPKAA